MPANRIGNSDWVVCRGDGGFAIVDGEPEPMMSRFAQNSLGVVDNVIRNSVQVFLPVQTAAALAGRQKTWSDITEWRRDIHLHIHRLGRQHAGGGG